MDACARENPTNKANNACNNDDKNSNKHRMIRKIIHRDGTVTLINSDDPRFDEISKSKKRVYTQTVHIKKITRTDADTGEVITQFERVEEEPVKPVQTVVLFDNPVAETKEKTNADITDIKKSPKKKSKRSTPTKSEQKSDSTTGIEVLTPKTPKGKKKKKSKKSKKSNPIIQFDIPNTPDNSSKISSKSSKSNKKSKMSKSTRSKSIDASIEVQMLSIPDSESYEQSNQNTPKESTKEAQKQTDFKDPNDIKLYDRSIYDFDSDSEYEIQKSVKKPPPIEKRYVKMITQHKNPVDNTIIAIEQAVPNEGYTLPPEIPEFNIVPLDVISLNPINPPAKISASNPVKNNDFKNQPQITEKPEKPKKFLYEFASDEETTSENNANSNQKVYFKYSQTTKAFTNPSNNQQYTIIENQPKFVQQQIFIPKIHVKKYKRKPNTSKNDQLELKTERLLPENEKFSISPMIMNSDDFISKYGTFPAALRDFLKEKEIDRIDTFEQNTQILKKVKPSVIIIDKRYYLETIDENGVINRARCTEDGRKIVVCSTKTAEEEIQAKIAKKAKQPTDDKKKAKKKRNLKSVGSDTPETPKSKRKSAKHKSLDEKPLSKSTPVKIKSNEDANNSSDSISSEENKQIRPSSISVKDKKSPKRSKSVKSTDNKSENKVEIIPPPKVIQPKEKVSTPHRALKKGYWRTINMSEEINQLISDDPANQPKKSSIARQSALNRSNSVEPNKKLTKPKFIPTRNLTMVLPKNDKTSEGLENLSFSTSTYKSNNTSLYQIQFGTSMQVASTNSGVNSISASYSTETK